MSDTVGQAAWVRRVLGVEVPDQSGSNEGPSGTAEPFQVFVKSLDGVTLTLTLPRAHETTIGELQGLVEDRTGITPGEQNLTTGTKPFNSRHAELPVSEYGIQRNQTLSLQGRLKGGFGERAAVAEIMLRNIKRGNVFGDVQATKGQSNKDLIILRHLTKADTKIGKGFLGGVANKAAELGLCKNDEQSKKEWLQNNRHFIKSIATTTSKAGNCMEHAEHVYAQLLTETTGQTVYQVSMTGADGDTEFDHRFVVTSPENHKKNISALMSDGAAMVVDAWWQNKIGPFGKFVDGDNPYQHKMKSANLVVRFSQVADGKGLDPALTKFATEEFTRLRTENQDNTGIVSKGRAKNLQSLVDDSEAVERLEDVVSDLKEKEAEARQLVQDWDEEVKRRELEINDLKLKIGQLESGGAKEKAEQDLKKLETELGEGEVWLDKATQDLEGLEKQVEEAESDLNGADEKLQETTLKFGGVFGDLFESWDKPMEDTRTKPQLFDSLDQANAKGSLKQLEKELTSVTDDEFINYIVSDDGRANLVMTSPGLVTRFQEFCKSTDVADLKDICKLVSEEIVNKFVKSVELLNQRLTA